jgi:prepilin-type N-terminal cleavage/methylation domain-containing protein
LHPCQKRGFTLVELLVVIGIIAVLMGILIPVVGHVRTSAYAASTQSQLLVIQAGIEQYRQTFEAYPGPLPDSRIQPATAAGTYTSSENLVFGLLGGWDPKTDTYSAALVGGGPASQNPLKAQRYQPFVDPISAGLDPIKPVSVVDPVTKVNVAQWVAWSDSAHQNIANPGSYKDSSNGVQHLSAPEFVDRFPDALPILYIRTRIGASGVVTDGATAYPAGTNPAYDRRQVEPYTFPKLPMPPQANPPFSPSPPANFAMYAPEYFGTLADPTIPRQKDGYLLISAGIDRIYGTGDDITNGGKLK